VNPVHFDIPNGTSPALCRGCRVTIYWIKTLKGKNMPVNPDGTSHFSNCPQAQTFRRRKH
jgi:hypothetical protein